MIPLALLCSMKPDSWKYSQPPHQKTGSGVQVPSTQQTCSPDLALIATRSTPSSGCMAVSFLRKSPLGPPQSAHLSQLVIPPTRSVNIITNIPVCQSQDLITSLLEHTQSLSKVIKALTFIHKSCRTWRANPNPVTTWNTVKTSISSSVIRCFARATEIIIATNKMKHLVVQSLEGVYYASDLSSRSRIGVSLICRKTILDKCIVNNAHAELGHGRDVLQVLSHIQTKFFIPGVQKMITNLKKSCPGCIKLNKKPFSAFEAEVPDVLKTIQPPFSYFQADIFGPILAHQDGRQLKRWVLDVLCLSSRRVHLEILHNYSAQSITRGFRRTFALRGTPQIIWIDAGLNIVKAGKDLINTEMKVISSLNLKFESIEFRVTLPKHHAGIGVVERIIGSIKNTVSKSVRNTPGVD